MIGTRPPNFDFFNFQPIFKLQFEFESFKKSFKKFLKFLKSFKRVFKSLTGLTDVEPAVYSVTVLNVS